MKSKVFPKNPPLRNQWDYSASPVWMVIPAAGIGRRMEVNLPKQYLSCFGKSLLEWTLDACVSLDCVDHIWVAVLPDDELAPALLLEKYDNKVSLLSAGGSTRMETVRNSLLELASLCSKFNEPPRILVHDAARPCVVASQVNNLVANLGEEGALLACAITDTVKKASVLPSAIMDGEGEAKKTCFGVDKTLERSCLWCAQTPQAAYFDVLLNALNYCYAHSLEVTDEASALEYLGLHPRIVPGDSRNFKITHPCDLKRFKGYLCQRFLQESSFDFTSLDPLTTAEFL